MFGHDQIEGHDRDRSRCRVPYANDPFSVGRPNGANTMRSVLTLGLLIGLCAAANAATVRRSKPPEGHMRPTRALLSPGATPFPVGPTKNPGPGWIPRRGQKAEPTAADLA